MSALHDVLHGWIVSIGLWLSSSLDLSAYDFYLWASLNGIVYRNTSPTEVLRNDIKDVTTSILTDDLRNVSKAFLPTCEAGLRAACNNFEHFL